MVHTSIYAASLLSVCEFLKNYEADFFEVVNAKYNVLELERKCVITEDIRKQIADANDVDAKEILYRHLKHHGNVGTLRIYCEVATAADVFPNMKELAERMMAELQPEGLF